MTYISWKHFTIFSVSLVLGLMGFLQYVLIEEKRNEFQEQNPLREIRLLLEGNQEMKKNIKLTESNLLDMQTHEQIMKLAQEKIAYAENFSGLSPQDQEALYVLLEGELEIKQLLEILHVIWNSGVSNISINGIPLSSSSAGLDTAGGEILIGGTPIHSPFLLTLYGESSRLLPLLSSNSELLQSFESNTLHITLSTAQ